VPPKRLELPNEDPLERKVVGHARDDARVGRQRDGRQPLALGLEPADEFRRHVLGIGSAAAVAKYQQLSSGLERGAHGRGGLDHRLLHRVAHAAMQSDRLVEHRLNDCGIAHSGARVLISEPELSGRIEEIRSSLPGLEQYYLTSSYTTYARPFSELLEANVDSAGLPVLDQNCAAAIYYTSGTTGLPKAVVHSHTSLARATQIQIDQIAISSEDRTLVMFPICYLIGFGSQILPFHSSGASCILLPHFEPRLALETSQG